MFAYKSPNSINSLTCCIVILLSDCKGNSCARLLFVALALDPLQNFKRHVLCVFGWRTALTFLIIVTF